jgi:magnesium and cobalt transporter
MKNNNPLRNTKSSMSEDNSLPNSGPNNKSFLNKIIQVFTPEPQNKDELFEILNDAQERNLINPETKLMIEGVLEVSEMRVRDIMIPRSQMVTIDRNQCFEEFLPIILESGHSRFPVVNEDIDHVDGILLAKDLLGFSFNSEEAEFNLADIIRQQS